MAHVTIDLDDDMLVRARCALGMSDVAATVGAALELAAAIDAARRDAALAAFRDLLARMETHRLAADDGADRPSLMRFLQTGPVVDGWLDGDRS